MCFFFNDTATTEIYTLSLHDALPISGPRLRWRRCRRRARRRALGLPVSCVTISHFHRCPCTPRASRGAGDRKSTRLNSSHANISYAVFCLKKKNKEHSLLLSISLYLP